MPKSHLYFLFTLLLLPACAQRSNRIEITWAVGKDTTGVQRTLVNEFTDRNPDIAVTMIEMPESAGAQRDSYVTYLVSRDPTVDVYSIDIIWPAEFAAAGWLMPLGPYLPAGEREDFLKGPLEGCTYNGEVYAVPWFTDAGILYYRADLLAKEKMAPPRTWDEMVRQAETLKEKYRMNGFVFQAEQYEGLVCNYLEYLWSFGGDLMDASGRPALDSPEALDALRFFSDLIHRSKAAPRAVLGYKEDDSRQVFTSGDAVFMRNWPFAWALAQDSKQSKVAGKTGIARLPAMPPHQSASVLGGWNLCISRFSRHPKEAWRFIAFMTGPEAEKLYAIRGGRLPTRRSVYRDKDVLAFAPHYRDLYEVFINARPRPATPVYAQLSDILQVELHQTLMGNKEPERALRDAQAKMTALLREKKLIR